MKKPKRLRFVASKKQRQIQIVFGNGMIGLCANIQLVVTGLSHAMRSLGDVARAAQELGRAISVDPEVRQEIKMQALYYQSWQRNDLADTLARAGIAHA